MFRRLRRRQGPLLLLLTALLGVAAGVAHSPQLRGGAGQIKASRERSASRCGGSYNQDVEQLYRDEVEPRFVNEGDRLGTQVFLDSTATQLYLNSQVRRIAELLQGSVFGNPHSASPSSVRTERAMKAVKADLLELFSARASEWELVFTRSATGALRIIGEALPWSPASALVLLRSNHNSVLGIREDACLARARLGTTEPEQVEAWLSQVEEAVAQGNLLRASRLGTQGPLCHSWASGEGLVRPSMCKGPSAHECGVAPPAPLSARRFSLKGTASSGRSGEHVQQQRQRQQEQEQWHWAGQGDMEDHGGECSGGLDQTISHTYSLFAYPAADNVNGQLFPLSWVDRLHRIPQSPDRRPPPRPPRASNASAHSADARGSRPGRVSCTGTRHRWLVLLDTAAFVPHHVLNLTEVQPDFAVMSFYKIFGLPTGLGAMIVRKEVARLLWPRYWAGGSIFTATASLRWQCFHDAPARLEAGTPAFLEIISLRAGLEALRSLGGVRRVHEHTQCVARHLAQGLRELRHSNGAPMVRLFGRWAEELGRWDARQGGRAPGQQGEQEEAQGREEEVQGPTANFIMLDPEGLPLSHKVVGAEASEAGIHVRVGCMCGPGQCYQALGISDAEVAAHARALASSTSDESWEEAWEFIEVNRTDADGVQRVRRLPLGTVRASLGWLSRWEDVRVLVQHLEQRYRDLPAQQVHQRYRQSIPRRREGSGQRALLEQQRVAEVLSSVSTCSGG